MNQVHGFTSITAIDGVLFIPPYNILEGVEVPFYENPNIQGSGSLVCVKSSIEVAKRNNIPARIMNNMYIQEPWCNSSFDYNEICLEGWPNIRQPTTKRRNEFRKLTELSQLRKLKVSVIDFETFMKNIPLLVATDSASCCIIPYVWNGGNVRQDVELLGYYFEDILVALGVVCEKNNIMFNYSLIRIDSSFTASEVTYWLANYAHGLGIRYLDIWNLALSPRETYKRTFFTGTRQCYCWSNGIYDFPWMHKL